MLDDTHMRWGVRPAGATEWSFAPYDCSGPSMIATPTSFKSPLAFMIENRSGWFAQWGVEGPSAPATFYVDYIRVVPEPATLTLLGLGGLALLRRKRN